MSRTGVRSTGESGERGRLLENECMLERGGGWVSTSIIVRRGQWQWWLSPIMNLNTNCLGLR